MARRAGGQKTNNDSLTISRNNSHSNWDQDRRNIDSIDARTDSGDTMSV